MATVVNMHEAKTQLSKLVARALAGEEIWIARAGKRMVRLTPGDAPPRRRDSYGRLRGKVEMSADFDEPLPRDVIEAFYGDPSEESQPS